MSLSLVVVFVAVVLTPFAQQDKTPSPQPEIRQQKQAEPSHTATSISDKYSALFVEAQNAAKTFGLSFDSYAEDSLRVTLSPEKVNCLRITAATTSQARAQRLRSYFSAKAGSTTSQSLTRGDLADFSCDYLATDFRFVPAVVRASGPVTLMGAFSNGKVVSYSDLKVQAGNTILLPVVGALSGGLTISASGFSGGSVIWTGSADKSTVDSPLTVTFTTSSTTEGCEIYVNSEPKEAAVFFNGTVWYKLTNTSVVRDPGPLKVKLTIAGYEDWVEERSIKAGETWTIDAKLKKKKH
jgi:PEGA domain-containing protein